MSSLPAVQAVSADSAEARLARATSELVRSEHRAEVAQALLGLHAACTRQRSVRGTARQIAAVTSALVDSPAVVVSITDPITQQAVLGEAFGRLLRPAEELRQQALALPEAPSLAWLRTDSRPRVLHRDSRTGLVAAVLSAMPDQRAAVVPLLGQGEYVGCLVASLPGGTEQDDDARLDALEELQPHAGDLVHLALVLQELRRRALHDATSGLPNRAVFEERLARALARDDSPDETALVVCQVDRCAAAVDAPVDTAALLRSVVGRLAELVPEHDLGHLGNARFAIITRGPLGSGTDLAAGVRAALVEPLAVNGGPVPVTCRTGVAVHDDTMSPAALVRAAEDALRRGAR